MMIPLVPSKNINNVVCTASSELPDNGWGHGHGYSADKNGRLHQNGYWSSVILQNNDQSQWFCFTFGKEVLVGSI